MHRTLSNGVESGSSFRMTQLLLPAAETPVHVHDSGTPERSRRRADELLPQLLDITATPDDAGRRLYSSTDNYRDTSWQTSITMDTIDYRPLPQRHCSVYRDTSGQSRQPSAIFVCQTSSAVIIIPKIHDKRARNWRHKSTSEIWPR